MNVKNKRYLISVILVLIMVVCAEYSGEREIIFPEILALTVGAWIADRQPWRVSKIGLVLLMTISALVGVGIVKYINVNLVIQVAIGLVFAGVTLKLTKTTLVPMISACILPIILGTETIVYPIAVAVMSIIIVLVQCLMERLNIREKTTIQEPIDINTHDGKKEFFRLVKLFLIIIVITIVAVISKSMFLMAPPLIVALVELSEVESKVRENPKKLFLLFTAAAIIGTSSRVILTGYLSLPLWIAAIVATIGIFMCFEKSELLFPPVAAIALLPMLLEAEKVKDFPLQAIIGSLIFIVIALIAFRE